ncbi:MAG: HD domain-containing protein [Deltaproteobacteria bacterium]|nr:HD domain-containing protein [Deltaproteobacteria bacterium]
MIHEELEGQDRQAAHLAAGFNGLVDVDLLLAKILASARKMVMAEAGTIYMVAGGRLRFASVQNDYLERLVPESGDLPFMGTSIDIGPTTLAGYAAANRTVLTVNNTDNIDLDAPFQHQKNIDSSNNYVCQTVMSLPLVTPLDDLLGVLQVINPMNSAGQVTEFGQGEELSLTLLARHAAMALEKALMLHASVLNSLRLVEIHDYTETSAHVQRVASLTTAIYRNWSQRNRVPSKEREHVLNILPLAAMLHDVGKAWIPSHILNKPGRLDRLEREVMEGHVLVGAKLYAANRSPLDRLAHSIIIDHHERWDGLGYPGPKTDGGPAGHGRPAQGKKGEDISIYGRILAVADVFDALSSRKTYKEPFDESLAVQIMEQESGHHFDPAVIESFLAIRPILRKIRERFPEDD